MKFLIDFEACARAFEGHVTLVARARRLYRLKNGCAATIVWRPPNPEMLGIDKFNMKTLWVFLWLLMDCTIVIVLLRFDLVGN